MARTNYSYEKRQKELAKKKKKDEKKKRKLEKKTSDEGIGTPPSQEGEELL